MTSRPLDPYISTSGTFRDPGSPSDNGYHQPGEMRSFATAVRNEGDTSYLTQTTADTRYEQLARKAQANGYAPLDANSLLPTAHLPPLAVTDTFVAATQAEMLALTAQRGDLCIRTDTGRTYVLSAEPASTLTNWKEVLAAGQVTSVNGQTGVVNLTAANVGAATSSDITNAIAAHQAAADPHPVYLTQPEADVLYATIGHNHDATYVNVTGDSMSGSLTISGKVVGVSPDAGNTIVWNANGFFAAAGAIQISPDAGNVLELRGNGLYVGQGLVFNKKP